MKGTRQCPSCGGFCKKSGCEREDTRECMKPTLYRYRDSESVIKPMEGYTPAEGWMPLYDQAAMDAAVAAERERCAKVCDGIAEDKWALYKGRHPYTGKEPGRASDFVQGQSDGADQCADVIRKVE